MMNSDIIYPVRVGIVIFVLGVVFLSFPLQGEQEAITFALPQALIINPELQKPLPDINLSTTPVYGFEYLYAPGNKKYIHTKIGLLGITTTSIDSRNRLIGLSYASLSRRGMECEILIPRRFKSGPSQKYALQFIILTSSRGPKFVEIKIGKGDNRYSSGIRASIKDTATLVLIPLNWFEIEDMANMRSIKFIVSSTADRDGVGSFSIKDLKVVAR